MQPTAQRRSNATTHIALAIAFSFAASAQQPAPLPSAPQPASASQSAATPPTTTTKDPILKPATRPPGTANSDATVTSTGETHHSDTVLVPSGPGVTVDQVLGVVNDDLILESDLDEERRFEAFQPFRDAGAKPTRSQLIERLVDRDLILQQARLQPDSAVSRIEAEQQVQTLRKDIPACKQYHCETEAGWDKFVHDQGFTQKELLDRWQQRMEILKFIEMRFRMGIRITPQQIKTYYQQTLLPEYARQNAKAPPLDSISARIQEILLQQQVGSLLSDWLEQLKAQGAVRMMHAQEGQS